MVKLTDSNCEEILGVQSTLTTGHVAELCGVATRTVGKWMDAGELRSWKIPSGAGRDRRTNLRFLLAFARDRGIHLKRFSFGFRTLIYLPLRLTGPLTDVVNKLHEDWIIEVATDSFSAGWIQGKFSPHVVIAYLDDLGKMILDRSSQDEEDPPILRVGMHEKFQDCQLCHTEVRIPCSSGILYDVIAYARTSETYPKLITGRKVEGWKIVV